MVEHNIITVLIIESLGYIGGIGRAVLDTILERELLQLINYPY